MTEHHPDTERRELEAADWFARLSRTPIETEELTRFQRWSRDPDNLAAYNDIEDISRAVRGLRDDPVMRAAAHHALAQPPERARRNFRGAWWAWGAGLAFAAVVSGAVLVLRPGVSDTYSTRVGEISSLRLDDGSQVRLNTDSTLRVRFTNGQRRVELLRGEAYFEVAHDTARPFVVAAGSAQVRAIGTAFDVRRAGDKVRIVLAEGRVRVTDRTTSRKDGWALNPGQGLVLSKAAGAPEPTTVDVAAATSWRTGTLTFHNVTLAAVVDELNRYSNTKIVLEASAPRELVVSGAFQAGDTAEFTSAASLLYGLTARKLPGGEVALSAPAAPGPRT
ncbi:FecR family protein [Caulobacter endophyticus]|uniref:Iron dicitrate transport regulator FecR n=1 Tax=Caulobacter endophyticus TaxID=2172652 RepID=A0A2T9K9X1_9CAUL|nr:FecR family protein [Caulobacter endophyticus]PVM92765.1 iron dicitrate transport regulator FecR [Caulobacter endophyticus]